MSHLARLQLTRRLPCTTTTTQRLNSGQTSNNKHNSTNSSSKQLINTNNNFNASYHKTLTRELSFNAPHLNQTQPKTDYRKSLKPYELNIS